MTAEKKARKPLQIKSLADLKRRIKLGTELVTTLHQYHPDIVGLSRVDESANQRILLQDQGSAGTQMVNLQSWRWLLVALQ